FFILSQIGRAPRAIHRVLALRHDAFEAKLAGMGEYGRAVALDVLVEAQAKASFGQHTSKRGLAHFQRIAPHVVAVQLDQVESVQERAVIMAAVANEIERGNAVVIAGNSLAVDDTRARAQAGERLDDQREAVGQVIAGAAVEPHALAVLARDDAETIVLNLVHPRIAARRLRRFGGQAGRNEAGRKSART